MAKFKINQEVCFMKDNKPQKKKITGVAEYTGKISGIHENHEVPEGEIKTVYHCGNYCDVEEKNVYPTMDALQNKLFGQNVV